MTIEYFRWKEYAWRDPDKDWRQAETITLGIDVGSVSSKAVVMTDGQIYCYAALRTGYDSPDSAVRALSSALEGTGLPPDKIDFCVGTGYGRVNVPMANRLVTEISCHARGVNFLCGPTARTILDMGGQDCKAIRCDERGKVMQFLMNDKCAAGTGRGMEVIAQMLSVPIGEAGALSLDVQGEVPEVSSTCVVFAKSEAMGLLRGGWSKNQVLAAYHEAMAHRVINLLRRSGMEEDFVITGGIAKNMGIVQRIEGALGVKTLPVKPDPQIVGAVGAALFALDSYRKAQKAANAELASVT
ncbi:MAG: benzoyl-CoA reductase, bzd-type, subunit Q [Dehalococcoidia bacterium]|nr:benzoyl-CoA reductase, bzd-type, subunit Q [Dehalococcoidia bacterium]